ncbi:tRNA pseudouridine(38-40) synthase TruA [Candidatus Omnitrophota bacterium]
MRNIRLSIEYRGTNYAGWQIQNRVQRTEYREQRRIQRPQRKTIQEALEKALSKILREKVRVIGSGRTDAGVHALSQSANFKTESKLPLQKLQMALNGVLPQDIRITMAQEAGADFHSRFCAKSKIYRYLILSRKYNSSFLRRSVCFCSYPLDLRLMRREAAALKGRHDFKSFCASGSSSKDTRRNLKQISIRKMSLGLSATPVIAIDIEADGFLYKMARNIVGTLIEIGRGKLPAGSLSRILKARERCLAGETAAACGLYLLKVKY